MRRLTAALLVALAVLSTSIAACAGQPRIAVLQPDDELLRAIALALSPWGLETIRSDALQPGSSQPEAVQTASRLARQLGVEALVWVSSLKSGALLWVFDTRSGGVTTRLLAETPPFDSAAAAAVALSVKTVLRDSVVAPPEERLGSSSPPPPSREGRVVVEIGAGGHWIAEREVDYRLELAGVLWLSAARRLGLCLELSSGTGLRIDHPDYRGRYRELVVGSKARFRLVQVPGISVSLALGGAAHWAMLRGQLLADSRERNVDRLNGSLDFESSFSLAVSRGAYLGASIGLGYSPTHRRYLVAGNPIFSPWPLTANFAGYYGVELF